MPLQARSLTYLLAREFPEFPPAFPTRVRTVTENTRTLKFTARGFESE